VFGEASEISRTIHEGVKLMDTLKVGVIGVGHLGTAHARTYKGIHGIELVGIHDINVERCREKAQECGCTCYDKVEDLLQDVQAVSIVVPTPEHHAVGMQALETGVHVLMEKPISRSLTEADDLIRLAKEKNVILQVGHIERFNPVVEKGNKVVDNPLFLECHRLAPFRPRGTDVDVILDLMIHDIDLALKFVGAEVDTISAVGIPVVTNRIDIANARISFSNHAVANITASRISKGVVRKMRLFQRDAYVSMDFHKRTIEVIRLNRGMYEDRHSAEGLDDFFVCDRSVLDEEEPLRNELTSFSDTVRTGDEPAVTGEDGRCALLVATRILEEIETVPINM